MIIKRPWGNYEVLEQTDDYWIKKITVNPSQRLSLQYHNKRTELWSLLQGEGWAWIDNKIIFMNYISSLFINKQIKHRMENLSSKPLAFIEIAYGNKLSEDDIVRVEDDYGRKP